MRGAKSEFVWDWVWAKVGRSGAPGAGWADGAAATIDRRHAGVLLAASVLDPMIEPRVLAHMLEIEERQSSRCLAMIAAAGHLAPCVHPGGVRYAFVDRDLRSRCYAALPEASRLLLHRRAAQAVGRTRARSNAIAAGLVAEHLAAAGDWLPAVAAWREAALLAIADAAVDQAIDCLQHALQISRRHASVAPQEELTTLKLLGPLLAQVHGSGSGEVATNYARCLVIADEFDAAQQFNQFDVLWGVCACVLVHGRIGTALELSGRLLRLAAERGETTHKVLACRLEGLGRLLAGDVDAAIAAIAEIERYADDAAVSRLRLSHASDQVAVALAHRALGEAIAGRTTASEHSNMAALKRAAVLQHPHTSAHVTCVLAIRALVLGQRDVAAPLAAAGRELSRRYHFAYWEAWAEMVLAWHGTTRAPGESAERLERAVAAYRATGAGQALPLAYMIQAANALAGNDVALRERRRTPG